MAETWMTLTKASKLLGMSRSGLLERIKSRKLRGQKDNKGLWRVMIDPEKIDDSKADSARKLKIDALRVALARVEEIEPALTARIAALEADLAATRRELATERGNNRDLIAQILDQTTPFWRRKRSAGTRSA